MDPCEETSFAPRYQQKKINVFVSSTFRDMQAERDELALRVFPALRKVCEERGIAWGEVDLRWGIPEEKRGEVLSICLKFIDDCRPYFIGMLGERYGWVEETTPDMIIKDYPWIKDHQGKSITELEVLHGVLNNPAMAGHAYFYFRDPGYIDILPIEQRPDFIEGPTPEEINKYGAEEAERKAQKRREQLATLKEKIRKSGLPIRENYSNPIQFGELVKADLMQVIDSLASPPIPLSDAEKASAWLDQEDISHEAFAASRFGVYIPRQDYFDTLDAHAAGDGPPLVVLGESGSGKSALLAHWSFRYRIKHPDDLVLVHFIGASSESTDWASMLRRFMGEFKRQFYLAEEIPEKEEDLMSAFKSWLSMAAAHGRVVLVIDALNQLEDRNGAPDLVWLPPTIPVNIRLIVSTLKGRPLDAVRKRGWEPLEVEPLTISERNALITCYLKKYHKELSPEVKEELASAPQSENPLFLRALLEEVRIHGVFENLMDQIRNYLTAQTVAALHEMILARYERDYERDRQGLVKDAVSLLWAARRGLSKSELMDLLGTGGKPLPAAYLAPLYLAMEHSLVEKDGLITFFHDYLRTGVEHRYLPAVELKRTAYLRISDYFVVQPQGPRRTEELPWQLAEAAEWDRLVALISDPSFFLAAWEVRKDDIKRYWMKTEEGSAHRMVDAYQPVIREPALVPSPFVWTLRTLLYDTGHLDEASALGEYLIQSLKELGNVDGLQASLGNQANILYSRGDLDGAMRLYKEQERICRELGNVGSLQISLGNQANILYSRGDLDGAMKLHKEKERICRELGNVDSLQISLGGQALILRARGDLDGAMKLFKEQERICRELGNVNELQLCLGNLAVILQARGDLDGAMKLHKEQERICRELGNVGSLQRSLGGQALILQARGDLDGAMKLHKEQERICRELGNVDGLQRSLGGQAVILYSRGDLDEAMKLYKEQERICRELENVDGFQRSLHGQANILYSRGDLDEAMKLYKEQERICRELGNVDSLNRSLGNQAVILYSRGDLDGAMYLHKEEERICRELGDVDGLQLCLGNQAVILQARGDLDGAMKLHKEQERICRELGNVSGLSRSLINQALIMSHQNQHLKALSAAEEAYQLASSHGYIALARQMLPILVKIRKEEHSISS